MSIEKALYWAVVATSAALAARVLQIASQSKEPAGVMIAFLVFMSTAVFIMTWKPPA